jgi:hypothetical protein
MDIRPQPGVILKHFTAPPRSPKVNGGMDRANRIHVEEFYIDYHVSSDVGWT